MSISKKNWLYIGQSIFGLLIGYMVGLSISPVVSTVLGLMFAFIGGSLIVLIKGKTDDELEVIGKCITALSSFMLLGVLIGITFRANDLLTFDFLRFVGPDRPLYVLTQPLEFEDIQTLGKEKEYSSLICSILESSKTTEKEIKLSKEQFKTLINENVDSKIILAMLGYDNNCIQKAAEVTAKTTKVTDKKSESGTNLLKDKISKDDQDRDDIPMTK